jgi:ABC-type Na+ efflux pump permease subunit
MGGVVDMSGLFDNPMVGSALRRASGPAKGSNPLLSLLLRGGGFALLILVPMAIGVCGCTMFTLSAVAMILATSLGVGNSAFGALTVEREKKTLDSLRLTQLSANEVLLGKLLPEFATLAAIVATLGPTVIAAGLWGQEGWALTFGAVGIAILAGGFSCVLAIFLSSLFATTSQAVVAGWITKGVWLLLTPMLDLVVGAVLVQNVSPPVFTSINPLAAFGVLDVPEAASGARLWLPMIFPVATIGLSILLWVVTARRFASGMANGGGLRDTTVHPVYHKGFGPSFVSRAIPVLRDNPSFLRELAAQIRAGAGRWPGYMVFLVLFLAPTFYARSWTLNDMRFAASERRAATVQVAGDTMVSSQPGDNGQSTSVATRGVHLTFASDAGKMHRTEVVLEGHTPTACLRMGLFQAFGVGLPKSQLRVYEVEDSDAISSASSHPIARPIPADSSDAMPAMSNLTSSTTAPVVLTEDHRLAATRSSLHVGIAGAIALLLLYLSIRFSAFLATAVTGERSRRTWEDLALTGISVRDAMQGKVLGAILLPLIQMSVVFPVLGIFVAAGNLTVTDVLGLYVYAVALSVAAAMLGLWASSRTGTSHDAHLRALLLVMAAFFFIPITMPGVQLVLIPLALIAACASARRPASLLAWGCIVAVLAMAPQAMSPLTAAVSFVPSLTASHSFLSLLHVAPASGTEAMLNLVCGLLLMVSLSVVLWNSAIERLTDGRDGEAIAAERPVDPFGMAAHAV